MKNNTIKCCVCGEPFSSHFEGKPYCNKHYLRMYCNGTLDKKVREKTCKYIVEGDVLKVITKNGDVILADVTDAEKIKKYSWCVSPQGYAVANVNGKVTKMNRYIFPEYEIKGAVIDHINRNKLDNRRENLRKATQKENSCNVSASKNNQVGFLGISTTKFGKYRARIMVDGEEKRLGNFDTLEEAVEAREKASKLYFGEYASSYNRDKLKERLKNA